MADSCTSMLSSKVKVEDYEYPISPRARIGLQDLLKLKCKLEWPKGKGAGEERNH